MNLERITGMTTTKKNEPRRVYWCLLKHLQTQILKKKHNYYLAQKKQGPPYILHVWKGMAFSWVQ